MFGRSRRRPEPPAQHPAGVGTGVGTGIGIGAQVYVLDAAEDPGSPFPDGPTGFIVRAGGSAWQGVSVIGGSARVWVVEFDTPQYTVDLEGPLERAQIPERYLRLAPPIADDE